VGDRDKHREVAEPVHGMPGLIAKPAPNNNKRGHDHGDQQPQPQKCQRHVGQADEHVPRFDEHVNVLGRRVAANEQPGVSEQQVECRLAESLV